jgi:hypothetical protein
MRKRFPHITCARKQGMHCSALVASRCSAGPSLLLVCHTCQKEHAAGADMSHSAQLRQQRAMGRCMHASHRKQAWCTKGYCEARSGARVSTTPTSSMRSNSRCQAASPRLGRRRSASARAWQCCSHASSSRASALKPLCARSSQRSAVFTPPASAQSHDMLPASPRELLPCPYLSYPALG